MLINTISASFTRPNDTTAYASGDLVANSTTNTAVVPMSLALANPAQVQTIIKRCRLLKSGTTATNGAFRVHFYGASPAVTNGDNGAWVSTKAANYFGSIDVTVIAFSDGCAAAGAAAAGAEMQINLSSGSTVYCLLEARGAYTPAAQEVFTLSVECADNY
jgi:hypothetical protein